MARPRVHDEQTAQALLDAAEGLVAAGGLDALSVRKVAAAVGTTTRAVYSLFGSKDGLVVALGIRAFDLLRVAIDALPVSDDPARDLVDAGVMVFRGFALQHPALFQLGVQQLGVSAELVQGFHDAAEQALAGLERRVARLADAQQLGGRPRWEAVCAFHALCEGLAALESRGTFHDADTERIWRDALAALIAGWAIS